MIAQPVGEHLRLIWPQWQGGRTPSVRQLAAEFPFDVGRRGYAVGSAVLAAVLPAHPGPSATIEVPVSDDGWSCATASRPRRSSWTSSRAPSGSSTGTGRRRSPPWAVDAPSASRPSPPSPSATGTTWPSCDSIPTRTSAPVAATIRGTTRWLSRHSSAEPTGRSKLCFPPPSAATGCSRVAVHFDVDTIDSNEIVLGLGAEPGGLSTAEVRRILDDVSRAAEVVGLTIAEFIPRQVMHLQQLLMGFPLLTGAD